MAKEKFPTTQAIRVLRQHRVAFEPRLYKYEDRGGTATSARELGIDEHRVIKTLVMEDEQKNPLIVLMHGDCEVSLKNLARQLGVKQVTPCIPQLADNLTGYQTGGISPFGTRKPLPIYIEETILTLEKICINGGKRGFLVEISPLELERVLKLTRINVAI